MNLPFVRRKNPLATLRQIAASRRGGGGEFCELCSEAIPPVHRHLLEQQTRKIVCSCDACALRFEAVVGGRFRLIPRDARPLPGFRLSDGLWESLAIPINLAFFFHNSLSGKTSAMYPSPAGATESLLPLNKWSELMKENPELASMQPDVEALLVNRIGAARAYLIAPIDACYELVGLIRMHWKGLSGGDEVWRQVDKFFARLSGQFAPAAMREEMHA